MVDALIASRTGQFGQAVGPLAGAPGVWVPRPRIRIGEPEVVLAVDYLELSRKAGGQLRGLPVREGDQEQVGVREDVRVVRLLKTAPSRAGCPGQLRVHRGHRRAGVAVRGQRTDLKVGMAGQ